MNFLTAVSGLSKVLKMLLPQGNGSISPFLYVSSEQLSVLHRDKWVESYISGQVHKLKIYRNLQKETGTKSYPVSLSSGCSLISYVR